MILHLIISSCHENIIAMLQWLNTLPKPLHIPRSKIIVHQFSKLDSLTRVTLTGQDMAIQIKTK
jgi:hypothetical protein